MLSHSRKNHSNVTFFNSQHGLEKITIKPTSIVPCEALKIVDKNCEKITKFSGHFTMLRRKLGVNLYVNLLKVRFFFSCFGATIFFPSLRYFLSG